jgi:uncharacterized phiE125 gp8 family phage protein
MGDSETRHDLPAWFLAEAKVFLRIDHDLDDAAIAAMVRSAAGLCERYTGQMLLRREISETRASASEWQRLRARPVSAITGIVALANDGAQTAIPSEHYAVDIDGDSNGWFRLSGPLSSGRVMVEYTAGLANDWNDVPDALRQGILRLAAHLYTHRDAPDDGGPPAAVAALWRPYRRMQLA